MTAEGAAPSRLDAIPSDVIEIATMRTSIRGFLTPEQTVDRLEERGGWPKSDRAISGESA